MVPGFFSLGHSTVVFVLAVVTTFAAAAVKQDLSQLQNLGGLIGASVSGVFFIGILNLLRSHKFSRRFLRALL